ncbi:MAG: XisI protein, partial [Sphaerospermopsis sp. SIO1G2]|nr:XisI protein [Sphaerospermopsis sp. SIO1G2]
MGTQLSNQEILQQLITQMAERYGVTESNDIEQVVIIDHEHGVYQIYEIGWKNHERVKTPWIHIRLKAGKFWIEEDWTEESIATRLIDAGISHDRIVLAFNPPDVR